MLPPVQRWDIEQVEFIPMSDKLAVVGGGLGLIVACVALAFRYYNTRQCMLLPSFLTVIFSTVGVASGMVLTYLSFTEEGKNLGAFSDFRLPLIGGGISLFWISLQGVINEVGGCFAKVIRPPEETQGDDGGL